MWSLRLRGRRQMTTEAGSALDQETVDTSTETETGAESAAPESGQDIGRLLTQFESFQGDVRSRLDRIDQRIPEPEAEAEADEELLGEDEMYDEETGALTMDGLEQIVRTRAEEMARKIVREELDPRDAERAAERRDAAANALEERYPALKDEEKQEAIVGKTMEFAQYVAQSTGRPELAELWREPAMIEMVYLAEEARGRARDEVPAGSEQEVHLERGGSAQPTGRQEEDDGDRIVRKHQARTFRLT